MKIRSRLLSFFLMLMLICLPTILVLAQGDPGDDPDQGVPFDGGLSLLIAAGIGYAAKKGYDQRKLNKAKAKSEK